MENVTRTKVLGRSIIIRKRVRKLRSPGFSTGPCFRRFDYGLWSLYISLRKPRKAVGFGKIDDR